MSSFLAIFPIHGHDTETRLHRQALNQLADITGTWTGRAWTDPDGRRWYIMTAPANGPVDPSDLAAIKATAHHIDPALTDWINGTTPPKPKRSRNAPHNATLPRLDHLQTLLNTGESVEDAIRACGWVRAKSAGAAARRAGNITLARTLEAAA